MTDAATTDTVDVGDHACVTFTDLEERLDLVSAFVRDGLRAGLKVVCWTDSISPDGLAGQLAARAVRPGAAIRRGQLQIGPVSGSLLGGASVKASAMVEVLAGEVEEAGREGYPGLWVTDMAWATRPQAASEELVAFESAVAGLFSDGRLCLICQYDRDRFDAVTLAFAAKSHPRRWPHRSTTRTREPAAADLPPVQPARGTDRRSAGLPPGRDPGAGLGRVAAAGPAHAPQPGRPGLHRRRLRRPDRGHRDPAVRVPADDHPVQAGGGHRAGAGRRAYRIASSGTACP